MAKTYWENVRYIYFEMKVVWNGSGDDGYCKGVAYNKEEYNWKMI